MKVRLSGVEIFYRVTGNGPPILLVHGFPLDHTMWSPQIEEFSKHYKVITPDLRGHGKSEAPNGAYTMELLASEINALLEHLGVGPVIVGGLSMGGYVAFSFYREFAHKVRRLILLDTRAEADTPEARVRREDQAQKVLREGAKAFASEMLPRMFTERTLKTEPMLGEQVRRTMEAMSPTGIAGALRGMAQRKDSTSLLASVHVPTLVIVGEEDRVTPVGDAKRIADNIPEARLQVISEAAHLTTLEKPAEVNTAIREFLGDSP